MKAIAIIALIFGAISILLPVVGVFLAMICSALAMISFRSQPTLAGVTFGLNILSTAFLSPSIVVAEVFNASSSPHGQAAMRQDQSTAGSIYLFYIGFHVVLLLAAIAWRLLRGPAKQHPSEA